MSKKVKELKEDGVFYYGTPNSIYSRGIKTISIDNPPVLRKFSSNEEVVGGEKDLIFSQTKNSNTGHWIKRNEISGELIIGNGAKPFAGIVVRRRFNAAPNPSINGEVAEKAEKAVLAILNRSLKK